MFETLGRVMVAPTATLKLDCEACGHRRTYSRTQAFAIFGIDASPFVVRRRSVCAQCGERRRVVASI